MIVGRENSGPTEPLFSATLILPINSGPSLRNIRPSIQLILDYFLKSFNQMAIRSKALILAVILLFIFLQSMLASRTPFIATMLCSVVLIFIYLRRKIFAVYVLGGLIILSVLLTLMIPSFSSRFKEISFSN